jgi:hypothetical protein
MIIQTNMLDIDKCQLLSTRSRLPVSSRSISVIIVDGVGEAQINLTQLSARSGVDLFRDATRNEVLLLWR